MPDVMYDVGLQARVDVLRERFLYRDTTVSQVKHVRNGDFHLVDPDAFNEDYPRPIIGNMIEALGREAAAALSKLPGFRCRATSMGASDAAKKRADKRSKVVNHYAVNSNLDEQMQRGADQFWTYGMVVAQIVPDFKGMMPEIVIRDSDGFYPVWNHKGETIEAAHVFTKRVVDLIAEYPHLATPLERNYSGKADATSQSAEYEVAVHDDGEFVTMFIPQCGNGLVLKRMRNPIGKCLFVCTPRVTVDGKVRGAFDDLVWVQLARNEHAMLTLEGLADAIEAPLFVPRDVTDVAIGPKSIIRTDNPTGYGRARMDLPNEAFAGLDIYRNEMAMGAIAPTGYGGPEPTPATRDTQTLSGYSEQIAMAQTTLSSFYKHVLRLCLMMDQALWPDVEKTCVGVQDGGAYDFKYTPSKDIDYYYEVDVHFGTMTGMEPNQHAVWLLQFLGAGIYSKDTVRRALPGQMNALEEESKIQVEQGRDSLMVAVRGLAESVGMMAQNGMDPTMAVQQVAKFVDQMEKGKSIEEIAKDVFRPPEPPPGPDPAAAAADPLAAMLGGGGDAAAVAAAGGANPGDLSTLFTAGTGFNGQPRSGVDVQGVI